VDLPSVSSFFSPPGMTVHRASSVCVASLKQYRPRRSYHPCSVSTMRRWSSGATSSTSRSMSRNHPLLAHSENHSVQGQSRAAMPVRGTPDDGMAKERLQRRIGVATVQIESKHPLRELARPRPGQEPTLECLWRFVRRKGDAVLKNGSARKATWRSPGNPSSTSGIASLSPSPPPPAHTYFHVSFVRGRHLSASVEERGKHSCLP